MTERMELPSLDELPIARMFSGIQDPPPLFTGGKPNVQAVFAWYARIGTAMYAGEAFAALGVLLMCIKQIGGPPDLSRRHFTHRQRVFELLQRERGLRALARNWYLRYRELLHADPQLATLGQDPNFLIDLAAIVAHLIETYPPALPENENSTALAELRVALAVIVERAMAMVRPQIVALVMALSALADLVVQISPKRTVILELPIGNSIPSKLLVGLLTSRGLSPEVLRVALPRNTSAGKGITRQAMIEQRLKELALGPNDLLVLVDEWVSGANFAGISDSLRRICNAQSTRFLPAALMTEDSSKEPRFESYCRDHDNIAATLGINGAILRSTIPAMRSRIERHGYFFWAEHDRLAGYRKVQVLGAWIRHIDNALEALRQDADRLEHLQHAVLAKVAEHAESGDAAKLCASSVGKRDEFTALFDEAYRDYQSCRDDLCRLEHPSNRGEAGDLGESTVDVQDLVARSVADRPARIAIALASVFLESEHIIDVDDQFPLSAHVPVVVELDGGIAELHDRVMACLRAFASEMKAGTA